MSLVERIAAVVASLPLIVGSAHAEGDATAVQEQEQNLATETEQQVVVDNGAEANNQTEVVVDNGGAQLTNTTNSETNIYGVVQAPEVNGNPCVTFAASFNVLNTFGVGGGLTLTDNVCMRGIAEQQVAQGHQSTLLYQQMVANVAGVYKYHPVQALAIVGQEDGAHTFQKTFCDAAHFGLMNFYENVTEAKAKYLQTFWNKFSKEHCDKNATEAVSRSGVTGNTYTSRTTLTF